MEQVEHYTVFLFCGLLPWLWLSSGLLEGTTSLVSSGHLITKSMFPAQILPFVSVVTNMVNFLLALPLLVLFVLGSGASIHWTWIFLPLLVALQFVMVTGVALVLSALNVQYRDVQHIIAHVLTFLFFLCPILYPSDVVPEAFRFTLDINPLAHLVRSYQDILLFGHPPSLLSLVVLFGTAIGTWIVGNLVFNSYRESFAELL